MKNTIDEAIEILQAFKAGKKCEWKSKTGQWIKLLCGDGIFECLYNKFEIRIAPEPKRVPLEAKDIPPVCWVKDSNCERMITGLSKLTFQTNGDVEHHFDHAVFNGWKYSEDRINWKPMWKEVE